MRQPSILFLTGHSFREPARVSVHLLALAAAEHGFNVSWVVAGVGPRSLIKAPILREVPTRHWEETSPGIWERAIWNWSTPVDLRHPQLNACATPLFSKYGDKLPAELQAVAKQADAIVVESGVAAPWLRALHKENLLSRTIYLAADDVRSIRGHPLVTQAVMRYVPAARGCLSFGAHADGSLSPLTPRIVPKGIDVDIYRSCDKASPYPLDRPSIICVGNMLFDRFVLEAAEAITDVDFHFIGDIPPRLAKNLTFHGPMPFKATVPFIKHAQAGLVPYRTAENISYLRTSSMKIAQFRACGLPIIAPRDLAGDDPAYAPYDRADQSSFQSSVHEAITRRQDVDSAPKITDYRENWEVLFTMASECK